MHKDVPQSIIYKNENYKETQMITVKEWLNKWWLHGDGGDNTNYVALALRVSLAKHCCNWFT